MDEYIKREDAIKALCVGCNDRFSDEPCEPTDCEMRNAINSIRAADVVPKSEYDAVVSAVDNSTQEFLKLHDDYQRQLEKNAKLHSQMAKYQLELQNSKRVVAREIFEEIDKLIIRRMIADTPLIDDRLITDIAELKKKYTEGGAE